MASRLAILQRAKAEAARSEHMARDTPWPLPLRGLLDEAKTAEFNGSLAAVLHNWRSNGVSLKMREGFQVIDSRTAIQRIPFEFGESPGNIKVFHNRIEYKGNPAFWGDITDRFSHTAISSNIIMANVDAHPILRCDGTGIIDAEFTTDTGKDVTEFTGVFSHHDRVYAWDERELAFYYGDIGAVTGELVRFPLDRLGNIRGKVSIITSMTMTAANDVNDVLVIITSTGDLVIYRGLNPSDSTDFTQIARLSIGAPVSRDAVEDFGSDLWLMTTRGIVSVRDSMSRGALALVSSVGSAIARSVVDDVKKFGDLQGWQMHARADGSEFIVNVPTSETTFKQYVFDTENEAWSTSDFPAKHWQNYNRETIFSAIDGKGCALRETSDAGEPITAILHTGWIRLGRNSSVESLTPTIIAEGEMEVKISVLTDHDETEEDVMMAEQIVTLRPDDEGKIVSLDEMVSIGATGRVFQLRLEVTGRNVEIVNIMAGVL